MNKQTLLIAGIALVVLIAGVFTVRFISGGGSTEETTVPTPTIEYQEVEGVQVTLTPNARKTEILLKLAGLGGRFTKLEYEVFYQTKDYGVQGSQAMGNSAIALSEGQDEFERTLELASCSTGGKCTYYTGVSDVKLLVKFHAADGTIYILEKEFETI